MPSRHSGFGGENPDWTICQVRKAIEAQLDPGISEHERTRRLHKLLEKIQYWQTHNTLAAVSHRKQRCQVLKRLGIDLSKLTKCFEPFVAL